jgi:hypothetical protein
MSVIGTTCLCGGWGASGAVGPITTRGFAARQELQNWLTQTRGSPGRLHPEYGVSVFGCSQPRALTGLPRPHSRPRLQRQGGSGKPRIQLMSDKR